MKRSDYPAPELLYVAHGHNDHQFSQLHLTLYACKSKDYPSYTELCCLTWQSNRENRHDWYGLHHKTDLSQTDGAIPPRLRRVATLLAKLLPEDARDHSPRAVLDRLHAARIWRGAYDCRLSRHVLERDAPSPDQSRWLDDWERYDTGSERDGCCVSALATDADAAVRALTREWGENLAHGSGYGKPERFASWIKAGCPVRKAYGDRAPEFPPLDRLLHVPEPVREELPLAA